MTERIPVPDGFVSVGPGLLASTGEVVAETVPAGPLLVVTDANVGPLYLDAVLASLSGRGLAATSLTLPPGEPTKTLETVRLVYDALLAIDAERGTPVVALGGGVVTDLAGFGAATFLRGLPWFALPTSVVGQVDASVGGKTGANLGQGKNLVGAFHHPRAVLADLATLGTLPPRHLRNGLAEVVKTGLALDPDLFGLLETRAADLLAGDLEVLGRAVTASVRAKARVVAADEREGGPRRVLNLGHTAGHAVEAACGYGPVLHGEAVAVGLTAVARIAVQRGILEPETESRLRGVLAALELPVDLGDLAVQPERERVRAHLGRDKKRHRGELRVVLPETPGRTRIEEIPEDELLAAVYGT